MSSLLPPIRYRQVGADGLALVGGKVWTYAAGTSTPKDTYTDAGLGTANTNPVILDTRGEADIWLDGAYKIIVTDSLDVLIPSASVDNVRDLTNAGTLTNPTIAGTPVFTGTNISWTGPPTHSGNHTWSGTQTFNGNVVIGDAGTDTLTVAPNAVTWSNNPTHSGNHTWSGTQTLVGNTTLTTWAGTTSGSVKLSATGVPYGTSIHNNAGAVTGTTNQYICSGTYTPTPTLGTNAAAATGEASTWVRVGNVVTVCFGCTVDPTAADTTTIVEFSLPPTQGANFAAANDANGCAATGDFDTDANMPSGGIVTASAGTQRFALFFRTGTKVTNQSWFGTLQYLVK